jgi:hypothetical protein
MNPIHSVTIEANNERMFEGPSEMVPASRLKATQNTIIIAKRHIPTATNAMVFDESVDPISFPIGPI